MQTIESIKEKSKELNDLFKQAAKEKIVIKGAVNTLGSFGEDAPSMCLHLEFYKKL